MSEISEERLTEIERVLPQIVPDSEILKLIAEIRRLREENAELRSQTDHTATSTTSAWDGPRLWWRCECGQVEKRPPNVHAAVCSVCHKQMKPAA